MGSYTIKGLPTYTYAEFTQAVDALKAEGISEVKIEKALKEYLGLVDIPNPSKKQRGRFKVRKSKLSAPQADDLDGVTLLSKGDLVYWWQKKGKVLHSATIPPGGYL